MQVQTLYAVLLPLFNNRTTNLLTALVLLWMPFNELPNPRPSQCSRDPASKSHSGLQSSQIKPLPSKTSKHSKHSKQGGVCQRLRKMIGLPYPSIILTKLSLLEVMSSMDSETCVYWRLQRLNKRRVYPEVTEAWFDGIKLLVCLARHKVEGFAFM